MGVVQELRKENKRQQEQIRALMKIRDKRAEDLRELDIKFWAAERLIKRLVIMAGNRVHITPEEMLEAEKQEVLMAVEEGAYTIITVPKEGKGGKE